MIFEDRIQVNPRLLRLKNTNNNEIIDFEIQDLEPEEIIQEGTEIDAAYLNGLLTNSMEEKQVGYWIDGKPIYRKVIYIASLPNHNTVAYPAGINNVNIVIDIYGIAHAQSGHNFPLPYVSMFSNNAENIEITYLSGAEVRVVTGSDRSSLSAHIVIEYTKTTD